MRLGSSTVPAGGRKLILNTHQSPNFGPRKGVSRPDMVVIHYTATVSTNAAVATLCDPQAEVSAHYLIDQTGEVLALVPEKMRAWHAGAGQWGAITDVNSHSIGIELSNAGDEPFAAAQMDALEELLSGIFDRWDIRPERVIGHSDMAPGRKIDPGTRFDWRRLARSGFGVWPEECVETGDFEQSMRAFGYTAPQTQEQLLNSFRLRFRPYANGPLDDIDRAMITDLAHRYPVDATTTSV